MLHSAFEVRASVVFGSLCYFWSRSDGEQRQWQIDNDIDINNHNCIDNVNDNENDNNIEDDNNDNIKDNNNDIVIAIFIVIDIVIDIDVPSMSSQAQVVKIEICLSSSGFT